MLDKYCQDFLNKSEVNYKLYEFLHLSGKFVEWQIVAIFYSALCYVKAYLYSKGMPINSINSHDSIKFYLSTEEYAKRCKVLPYYSNLYRDSRDARYSNKQIKESRINFAISNYQKVKELLDKNFEK